MTGADREPAGDGALVRAAARAVALYTAAAVAAVVLVVAVAVFVVDERQQAGQADSLTRGVWVAADDVADPPQGAWLAVVERGGRRAVTDGAPAVVREVDPAALPDGAARLERQGHELAVWTGDRRIGRVSAVADVSAREVEERRLMVSLAVAALLGALGAAAVGALIGRRAVRPLADAMALQRQFVADASHELRTPLTLLLTRAQLLRRHLSGGVAPGQRAELDRLVTDAMNLGEVVSDLLRSAELGQHPGTGESVDVGQVAADVVASLQPLAAERSVRLTATGTDSGGAVAGAPGALRRALTSLVDNALSHTPVGGRVEVRLVAEAGAVSVSVVDDGTGVDPAGADRLVQRFSRGTSRDAGRRVGLGLALVDEIARGHGGALLIGNEPGRGAAFTLRLPLVPAAPH